MKKVKEDIDKFIDELIDGGDIDKAIEYLLKEGSAQDDLKSLHKQESVYKGWDLVWGDGWRMEKTYDMDYSKDYEIVLDMVQELGQPTTPASTIDASDVFSSVLEGKFFYWEYVPFGIKIYGEGDYIEVSVTSLARIDDVEKFKVSYADIWIDMFKGSE